jgi:hypothetical protein
MWYSLVEVYQCRMYCFCLGVKEAKQETSKNVCHQLHLIFCLAYSSALKMDVICSSEMLVDFYETTWCHISEDSTSHSNHCENLRSKKFSFVCGLFCYALRVSDFLGSYHRGMILFVRKLLISFITHICIICYP